MKTFKLRTGLVIVLVVTLGGCSSRKKPAVQAANDQTIVSDVQAKLFQDPVLKTRDIQVSAQNGVVTLAGTVNTDLEKGAAERFASQENGVKQVVDQLTIPSATTAQVTPAPPAAAVSAAPPPAKTPRRKRHTPAETAREESPSPPPEGANPAPESPIPAPVVQAPPSAAPTPPAPVTITIPAGTAINVRMIDGIDSAVNQPGQRFSASLAAPVVVGNTVVIPGRSNAIVELVRAESSGKFKGSAQLALQLRSVTVVGTKYNVRTSTYQQTGGSRGRRTAETVGGGGVLGALIGGIAGKGTGAAIGAGIGAASGAGVQALSKNNQVKIPSETRIGFTLAAPLTVTLSQ